MPLYTNPNFRRLPSGLASVFETAGRDSFFALPAWYDLMARYGVPGEAEIRAHTDERAASAMAVLVYTAASPTVRSLTSLANAHSLEHGIVHPPGVDLETGLARILPEILAERPHWDYLSFAELEPEDPSYGALVGAPRRAGLLVECTFNSGTWYEETAGLSFTDYLAARPSELRNTWRRKRRNLERGQRLTKSFLAEVAGLDQAIADYQTIYAASWKPAELFLDFVSALMRVAGELGALRLGIYYVDGVPAAAQFWIVWNSRAVICKLAHDKRFDELSLGTLLTMEMVERVLAEDRPREITLGRGDDAYKKLWLPKRRERWGITAGNPRTLRGLRLGLKRQAATIYHRLRGARVAPFG
jgi:GNAT acetyltransferase-like protein